MNELAVREEFDLVVSNFAFTELRRPIQEIYFHKLIGHCPRGYISYNEICPPEFEALGRDEIC